MMRTTIPKQMRAGWTPNGLIGVGSGTARYVLVGPAYDITR